MSLIDRVQQDMSAAMKAREESRLSALRMIKAALMKKKGDSPKPLDEADEMQVLKIAHQAAHRRGGGFSQGRSPGTGRERRG